MKGKWYTKITSAKIIGIPYTYVDSDPPDSCPDKKNPGYTVYFLFKGYIADEFGPEVTQTQKEESKDGDGEDGPRPKQPRSSADRIGTSEVGILGRILVIKIQSKPPSNLLY